MSIEGFRREFSTILGADIKAYGRLMGEDEVATVRALTAHREVITSLIQQFRGRAVDSPGDNLLAECTSLVDRGATEPKRDIYDAIAIGSY